MIPPEDKSPGFENNKYARFKRRPLTVNENPIVQRQLEVEIVSISDSISWSFYSARADIYSGLPRMGEKRNCMMGFCQSATPLDEQLTSVNIAFEIVEPMLSANLTPTERALEIFRLAITILHEMVVSYHTLALGLSDADVIAACYLDGKTSRSETRACTRALI